MASQMRPRSYQGRWTTIWENNSRDRTLSSPRLLCCSTEALCKVLNQCRRRVTTAKKTGPWTEGFGARKVQMCDHQINADFSPPCLTAQSPADLPHNLHHLVPKRLCQNENLKISAQLNLKHALLTCCLWSLQYSSSHLALLHFQHHPLGLILLHKPQVSKHINAPFGGWYFQSLFPFIALLSAVRLSQMLRKWKHIPLLLLQVGNPNLFGTKTYPLISISQPDS